MTPLPEEILLLALHRGPLLSYPMQNIEVCCTIKGWWGVERTATRAFGRHRMDMDPPNYFVDSKKSVQELLGNLLMDSPAGHGHLQYILCLSHTLPSSPSGYLSMHTSQGGESKLLQLVSEHVQKVSLALWNWKKTHKLEHSAPP